MRQVRAVLDYRVRTRRFVLLLLAITLVVLGPSLWKAAPFPLWVFTANRTITAEMARQKIPGLSIAVAYRGSVRWSSGFGLADIESHVPARAETIYRWASISKPITATAALRLVERGKLDLDAPIQKYVPRFPEKPWPITSRQLLGHLGGVRHYQGDERESVRHYDKVIDALAIFEDDPLVSEPGTKHVYSTYGYNLLGAVVEGASGKPYVEQIGTEIFGPAKMFSTRVDDLETLIPFRARGYIKGRDGVIVNVRPIDPTNKIPGAGFCGTVEDLARFALAIETGVLLNRSSREAMFTKQKTRDGREVEYGLGWSLSRYSGRDEVWHSGRMHGVTALLYMLPDRAFAIAIVANLENVELIDLARRIAGVTAPSP